jgi:hypothetical protein
VPLASPPHAQPTRLPPLSLFFFVERKAPPCRHRAPPRTGAHARRAVLASTPCERTQGSTFQWLPRTLVLASSCFARDFPVLVIVAHAAVAEPLAPYFVLFHMHAREFSLPAPVTPATPPVALFSAVAVVPPWVQSRANGCPFSLPNGAFGLSSPCHQMCCPTTVDPLHR